MSTELILANDQARNIEATILLWLDEKGGKSQSRGTRRKYERNISSFRAILQHAGLDLDADRRVIAMAAQGWAAQHWRNAQAEPEPVSNATYNQRIASLSSFYEFAIKRELAGIERNPIKALERRKTDDYQGAQPMSAEDVQQTLESINRSTPAGERDYVLLSLGFSTGRRVSELAGLRAGDLTFAGTTQLRIYWRRTKGGKSHTDTITDRELIALLRNWICQLYRSVKAAPKDAALWPSFSNNHHGQPISVSAIANICYKHLGTYETHTMRHSFTAAMKHDGASDEAVGEALTHAPGSRATRKYIRRIEGQANPHATAIRKSFGIKAREQNNTP